MEGYVYRELDLPRTQVVPSFSLPRHQILLSCYGII